MLYFIQSGTNGPIKIGYASTHVQRRLGVMQVGNPCLLRCLGVMDGTRNDERVLLNHNRAHRIRGEWFKPHAGLMQFIAEHTHQPEAYKPEIVKTQPIKRRPLPRFYLR